MAEIIETPNGFKIYKIITELIFKGCQMNVKEFDTFLNADKYWNELSWTNASIFFIKDIKTNKWNVYKKYGTNLACQRIIEFENTSLQDNIKKISKNDTPLSKLSKKIANTLDKNMFDEFKNWTEDMDDTGMNKVKDLSSDDVKATDLIVSMGVGINTSIIFVYSHEKAQEIWKSLGVWFASGWYKKKNNIWLIHDTFGFQREYLTKIYSYVNDSQKQWNNNNMNINENKNKNNNNDDANNCENENNNNNFNEDLELKMDQIDVVNNNKQISIENNIENNEAILNDNNIHINDNKLNADKLLIESEMKNEDEDDRQMCIVCMNGKRDHSIIPCGHLCLCIECKNEYINGNNKCPICRKDVERVIKIYQ